MYYYFRMVGYGLPVGKAVRPLFILTILVLSLSNVIACSPTVEEDVSSIATSEPSGMKSATREQNVAASPTEDVIETPIAVATPLAPTPTATNVQAAVVYPRLSWALQTKSWAISGLTLFLESSTGNIEAYLIDSSSLLWRSEGRGAVLASDDENVYVLPSARRIDALDVRTGEVRWTALLEENFVALFPNGSANGLFLRTKFNLLWFDKFTGNMVSLGGIELDNYVIGDVIILRGLRSIKAFSQSTGQFIWERQVSSGDASTCVDIFVFINREETSTSYLEALDIETGNNIWNTQIPTGLGYDIICPQSRKQDFVNHFDYSLDLVGFVASENNIYIYGENRPLAAFEDQTGEMLWADNTINDFNWLGEEGGLIFYSSPAFAMTRAYEAETHNLVWENLSLVTSRVVGVIDDTLIMTLPHSGQLTYSGLVGLDMSTGDEKWRYEGGTVIETAAIIDDYVVCTFYGESTLRFFDPHIGQLLNVVETSIKAPPFDHINYLDRNNLVIAISKGEGLIGVQLSE